MTTKEFKAQCKKDADEVATWPKWKQDQATQWLENFNKPETWVRRTKLEQALDNL